MVMFVQRSPWRALNALLIEWPSIGRVAAVPHEGRGVMIAALFSGFGSSKKGNYNIYRGVMIPAPYQDPKSHFQPFGNSRFGFVSS